jgi:hypothetical protein
MDYRYQCGFMVFVDSSNNMTNGEFIFKGQKFIRDGWLLEYVSENITGEHSG